MHTKDARALGETEMRLYGTGVWRDTPFFSPRERAAFALTEALTRLDPDGIPEAVLAETRGHFSETELVNLSMVIIAINMWNRYKAVVHGVAGSYRPAAEGQHR
jgi:alkylhydroperoxidase family enzyme